MRRRNFLQLIGIVAIPNAIQAAEFGSSPVRQEKFQQRYRAYHEEGVQRLCDLNGAYPLGIDMTPGGVNYASCDFHFVMPDLPRNTTTSILRRRSEKHDGHNKNIRPEAQVGSNGQVFLQMQGLRIG